MRSSLPILIIGAGGKTGRRVLARLTARGIATRAVSRSTPMAFDWAQPLTWRPALRGTSSVYVTYQPDLAAPGATAAIAEFSAMARQEGIERVVLLSGRGEPAAERAERVLRHSGVTWTCVRASWFNQNFSEGFLYDSVMGGTLAVPAGSVCEPFVDAEDIADVVLSSLTESRHGNVLYELTGPRALSFAEAADILSAASGRAIRYIPVSQDEFACGLKQAGVPEELATLLCDICSVVLDGRNARPMPGIEQALGRPARNFTDYVRAAAAAGAWRA